jgi:branched-chain amino acid aminotransferase
MAFINLNGKLLPAAVPALQADNRCFRYGYGIFETLLVRQGRVCFAERHKRRMNLGLDLLALQRPLHFDRDLFDRHIPATVKKNGLEKACRVRVQLFGGSGGIFDHPSDGAQFLIECLPVSDTVTKLNENGLVVGMAEGLAKTTDASANLKSCNALIYVLAANMAREQRWNDALIPNAYGRVVESTIANLFMVKDGVIFTPPLAEGCVAGIIREVVLEQFPDTVCQPITREDLQQADEVFLTNAVKRVKWVRTFGDNNYSCDVSKSVAAAIKDLE